MGLFRVGSFVEGTYRLEGLIEGVLAEPEQEARIRQWAERARAGGFPFFVTVEANSVSLLADEATQRSPAGAQPVDEQLRCLLEELLSLWDPEERGECTSTLRSVEYQPGIAVQTVYGIDGTGLLHVQQRTIPEETTPPPLQRSWREHLPRIGIAAGVVVVLFLASLPFVPYGKLARDVVRTFSPLAVDDITVDAGAFREHLKPVDLRRDPRSERILLLLEPTDAFPATDDALQTLWQRQADLHGRLMVEALARRRIRCEFRNEEGTWLGVQTCNLVASGDSGGADHPDRQDAADDAAAKEEAPLRVGFFLPRGTRRVVLLY